MRCSVTADKHVNEIRDISRQPHIITIEGLLQAVFSVGPAPRLYNEDPTPAESAVMGYSPDSNDVMAGS
jgi:hypothetical protein